MFWLPNFLEPFAALKRAVVNVRAMDALTDTSVIKSRYASNQKQNSSAVENVFLLPEEYISVAAL